MGIQIQKSCVAAFVLILILPLVSVADRGMLAISANPDITISEGAQRAIIAFNGAEEILILATEASASVEGSVLEFLPLPSAPIVEESSNEVFERAMLLINSHAPTLSPEDGKRNGGEKRGGLPGIDVVSRTTIGPHDVTVVKIESAEHFIQWITDFYSTEGITAEPTKALEMKELVEVYLKRGIFYFVFDSVTIGTEKIGIAPLSYRFATDSLYFPLEISSKTTGDTEIDLFLVTPGVPKKGAFPKGFSVPDYVFPKDIVEAKKAPPAVPISFEIDMSDRVTLSPAVARLIPGWETRARFTVIRYRGPLSSLFGDLVLEKSDFEDPDFEGVMRALDGRRSLSDYSPVGTVNLTTVPGEAPAPFKASASGSTTYYLKGSGFFSVDTVTVPASYTAPAAVDGDPSTPFVLRQAESWWIDLGRSREIDSVDILAAVPIPDRDTSYSYGIKLLASDTGKFAGEQRMVGSGVIESYTKTDLSDDPARRAKAIRLTDRPVNARFFKIEYIPYGAYNDIYLFEVMLWEKEK